MKRLFTIVVLLAAAGGAVFSQAAGTTDADSTTAPAAAAPAVHAPSFIQQELQAAGSELSSNQVGTMTVSDLEKLAAHLSIAIQKSRYVERARSASFMLPGVGQFMTGDTLGGWLFIAWDVTVFAGTLVTAYFVLPSNVQFGAVNYLSAPLSSIKSAWDSNSIVAYLPLAGVLLGGMVLDIVLRYVSADNAAQTARNNINAGKVTFEPTLDFLDGAPELGMKFRY